MEGKKLPRLLVGIFLALILALITVANACQPQAPSAIDTDNTVPTQPGTLKRNCTDSTSNFYEVGLGVGDRAIDFSLKDKSSTEFALSQFLVEKPVVMVFGSYT